MNKCIMCQKEYEAKRVTAKFCSSACRVAYARTQSAGKVLSVLTKELSVTDKGKVSVTPLSVTKGKCHGCGQSVSDLVCICLSCVNKGVSHEGLKIDMKGCE